MRRTLVAAAIALAAASALAQNALQDITFQWKGGAQNGFTKNVPEIDRYDTLRIDVDKAKFAADAAKELGGTSLAANDITRELQILATTARALGEYHKALAAAIAESATSGMVTALSTPEMNEARGRLDAALTSFRELKNVDPDLYRAVEESFGTPTAYSDAAKAIADRLNQLTTEIQQNALSSGALGITATIVPPDASARPLHLDKYDQVPVANAPAVPNFIPVIDERTRAEITAAQSFRDIGRSMTQISSEFQKSIQQLEGALQKLRSGLKTNVLEAELNALIAEIDTGARRDLGQVRADAVAARDLVQRLNSVNLTLEGATDADKLLNLASTLNTTAQALIDSSRDLPAGLKKLAADIETAVRKVPNSLLMRTNATIRKAIDDFVGQQTFFTTLAGRLKSLGLQLEQDSRVALSADRVAAAARDLDATTDYSTALDLSTIQGAVHVRDNIVVQAALYRRLSPNKLDPIESAKQSFVIQRYALYPDSVRGGLLFADPRSKIQRNIHFQPAPAIGYFWHYGIHGRPRWNAESPAIGFSMTILDFNDAQDVELGLAGTVAFVRNLVWVGYGRNLQAKANYFFIGTNPLELGKRIVNR
jgi:hypothetical protein